ncbi:MAG: hypothetical protein PHU21_12910, partial [Elusimicrobia bacterium]|nr:hypothetical protein [Elusimicrobiota bacterium]
NGGGLSLLRYRAFRSHLQYALPGGKWAASVGYGQIETRNVGDFGKYAAASAQQAATDLTTGPLLSPKTQFGYATVFYDALSWLRFCAELNQTRVTYTDAANRFAVNNRFQFTTFLIF